MPTAKDAPLSLITLLTLVVAIQGCSIQAEIPVNVAENINQLPAPAAGMAPTTMTYAAHNQVFVVEGTRQ